jgi:hypothetical protein
LVVNSALYFNPPYFNIRLFYPSATSLLTLADPFPMNSAVTPPPSLNSLSPDLATPYIQNWNFDIQQQIGTSGTLSIAYAGSKGTHLIRSLNLNQPSPGAGNLQSREPYPAFGDITYIETGSNSNYNSLQASYQHRLTKSLLFTSAYTYSKSIDDTSAFLGDTADPNYPQNSRDFAAERALSSFDMRHRGTVAWAYALPWRAVWLRNTEFRGLMVAQTGHPITPLLRFDNSNTGNTGSPYGYDRPNVVGSPNLANPTANEWFNTSAFAIPTPYTFGNAGRNILEGPGLFSVDVSVARRFPIRERLSLWAEVQAFNVLNHTNFDLPDTFVDDPTFGRISSAEAAREVQISLRLQF